MSQWAPVNRAPQSWQLGPPKRSLHVTVGVETDTDHFTWLQLLRDAATALRLPDANATLDSALWQDERLREALPLPLCRHGGSFGGVEPSGGAWFARAKELLHVHLRAHVDAESLRDALDEALTNRQAHVEAKRQQLLDFLKIGPPVD